MSKKPDFIGEVWGCLGHSWLWVLITWLWPQFQLFHWALWSSSVSLLSSTSLDPTGFPLNISPNSSTLLHWLPVLHVMSALLCLVYLCPPQGSFPRYCVSDNSSCYNRYQRLGDLNSKTFISHCSGGWEVWNQGTSMVEFWWGLQLEHVTFRGTQIANCNTLPWQYLKNANLLRSA